MSKNMVEVQQSSREQLEKFATHGFLYAILDATDTPAIPIKTKELGNEKAISLFADSPQQDYWRYAPYLVKVDSELLKWIEQTLWTAPWGVFVVSNSDLATLSAQLRKLLRVRAKSGEEYIFRYYDPRVLGDYLGKCSVDDSANFFNQVRAYAVSDNGNLKLYLRQST
jgi:hypothetical protein